MSMDEVLEKIADSVSTLILVVKESEEKDTLFGDLVPAAEIMKRAAEGFFHSFILSFIHSSFSHYILSLLSFMHSISVLLSLSFSLSFLKLTICLY